MWRRGCGARAGSRSPGLARLPGAGRTVARRATGLAPGWVTSSSAMIHVRKSNERGHADHGWLDTHHTFSFGDYYDPEQMGFRALRVINEDRVAAGAGLRHARPPGHGDPLLRARGRPRPQGLASAAAAVIRPGDVQRMSAGSGVMHSEFNASRTEPVHFLQIWIVPERRGITPGLRAEALPARAAAGPAPPHRLARRPRTAA